jgi:hypothetical protein
MKFILSIVYLISFLALANAADGAVSSSLRGSNNYPTLEDSWTDWSDCMHNCYTMGNDDCPRQCPIHGSGGDDRAVAPDPRRPDPYADGGSRPKDYSNCLLNCYSMGNDEAECETKCWEDSKDNDAIMTTVTPVVAES